MTIATDYTPRFATCESRLRLAGASCATISAHGSRYFALGRDLRVRVSDHPSGERGHWHQEVRVDQPDWQEQLNRLLGPVRHGVVDMPSAVYFGDHSAVSQSMLKVFADRRRLYEGYFVTGAIPQPEDSDPMRKGTALHTALLEPHRFDRIVVTFPPELLAKNGAVSTTEAKEFRAEHEAAGKVVLKEADADKVRAMAESVKRVCGKWLDLPAVKERALYWTDELTGLNCKLRLDWLIERGTAIMFDLKSTGDSSPPEFRKRIEGNGYWMQAAHYIEGVKAATGAESVEFYFIAVEDKPPYACALYALDSDASDRAAVARRRLLNELHTCIETGDFSEPWETQVTRLQLREFCFTPHNF